MDDVFAIALPKTVNPTLELPDPTLVQYYKDQYSRTIWITEEISENVYDWATNIIEWNRDDQGKPAEERTPIKLIISSPGGALDCEETLVSIIKLSTTPIYGIAIGCVASAASLIYLSCHKKFAMRNAYFILHKGSCSNVGNNYNDLQNFMDDYKSQVEKMEKFYIENTSIPADVIHEKINNDWYIRDEQILEYGLIDEWITSDLSVFM